MLRKFSLLLAMLAWCCLAIPWQSCDSDCRNGSLQPLGHGCHPKAEATHSCHCGHDHVRSVAVDDADATGPERLHRCEDGQHTNLVFQQFEPERSIELDDEPDEPSPVLPSIAIPSLQPRVRVVGSPVDPPGREPQRMQQLRVDVLPDSVNSNVSWTNGRATCAWPRSM